MEWKYGLAVGLLLIAPGCGGEPKPPPPGAKEVEDTSLEVDDGTKVPDAAKPKSNPDADKPTSDEDTPKPVESPQP